LADAATTRLANDYAEADSYRLGGLTVEVSRKAALIIQENRKAVQGSTTSPAQVNEVNKSLYGHSKSCADAKPHDHKLVLNTVPTPLPAEGPSCSAKRP
jgi:hypothetical protein